MSYSLKLGTFNKHIESTKQPNVATWTNYDVVFKDGTDVVNPTVVLSIPYSTAKTYNYGYMLDRYYWIENIKMVRTGLCEIQLKTDVLATYKSNIGSASLYILRSSVQSDGDIQDNLYPPTANVTRRHVEQPVSSIPGYVIPPGESEYRNLGYDGGYIVLNVAGTGTLGATTLIMLTTPDFKRLIKMLYEVIDGYQLGDVVKQVVKKFGGNPQELINGALWTPWPFYGDDMDVIHIGGWDASELIPNPDYDPDDPTSPPYITDAVYGLYIDQPVVSATTVTFTIQKHPQAATRGAYLNLSPYTSYIIGVPGCGVVTLDAAKLKNETSINVYRTIDAISGQYVVEVVANSSGQKLAHLVGQMGVPLTLRGSNNATNVVGDIGQTLGAVATGNVIGAVTGAIGGVMNMAAGTPMSSGAGGSFAGVIGLPIWLDTLHYSVTAEDNTHNGRPYCQVTTPATLGGGYMIAERGDVDINGTLPEQEEIKRFLESGFYYE